jgi:hypothetical protein
MRIIKRLNHVCIIVQIDCKCVSRKMSQTNEDDSIITDAVALCVVPVTPYAFEDLLPSCLCVGYDT